MLVGIVRQGLQCRECDRVCHVKCKDLVANDCGLNALILMRHLKQIEDSKKDKVKKELKSSCSTPITDKFAAFDHLLNYDFEESTMTDCLYKSLALTRAPDKLRF